MNPLWSTLATLHPPSTEERQAGERLLAEYLVRGCLPYTCRELLSFSDGVFTHFYHRLGELRPALSPVADRPDSGWMAQADFCFINIRATGLGEAPGKLLHAAKLLPGLRASAIHLGPFTSYDFGVIYAVRSVRTISPAIVDEALSALGFSAEAQMQAFVDAAHLLGKAVGFDIEPHMAQFSIPAVEQPHLFRWLKLDAGIEDAGIQNAERRLADDLTYAVLLSEPHQARICAEVRRRVRQALERAGWETFESIDDDLATTRRKEQAFFALLGELIQTGYWPILAQVWSGDGLPDFDGYNTEGNYPRFRYLSRQGEDHSPQAYHILAPFKFCTGLPANQAPQQPPPAGEDAIRFFCEIFPYWRDRFGFDFVRYDSVDHIFDSLWNGDPRFPASDRPAPDVLRRCIAASRSPEKPYIGSLAERMGNEIHPYADLGYDLMLGNDMLQRIDRPLIEKSFWLYDELCALNRPGERSRRATPFGVPFCVDTHDTGNPFIWGEPLVKVMGFERMRLRHFVAGFIGAGLAPRPKYEVIGSQDLSYGLYRANVREVNLEWVGDAAYNQKYHQLEDLYERFRQFLSGGEIVARGVDDRTAWWIIQNGSQRLVPIIALETGDGNGPLVVNIPLAGEVGRPVDDYDVTNGQARTYRLEGESITLEIPYLHCRLLHIY